ncbi:MAG TPA: YdeI/OmpD-associated family protein [Actinomycetota bacterium]|nr:YdeI/OmpD-associated family protein [Actinomycetota bacterium]
MTEQGSEITADDLLDALAAADALETFLRLPPEAQEHFALWIGKSRDDESHWRRINALALALRMGPLRPAQDLPVAEPG